MSCKDDLTDRAYLCAFGVFILDSATLASDPRVEESVTGLVLEEHPMRLNGMQIQFPRRLYKIPIIYSYKM